MDEDAVKVCRLCMKLLFKEKYFDINYVEGATGFMPFRDQITTCMPELALDILPECFICLNCADFLKASYNFKTKCLKVEDKVRSYFDSTDNFNILNLSKFVRYTVSSSGSGTGEVECTPLNLDTREDAKSETSESEELVKVSKRTKDSECMQVVYKCLICKACFNTPKELVRHKKATHKSPFVCNFCNKQFESLFFLRQHNTLCKNKESKEVSVSVATKSQKRPHLPAKAKNHLTEWLYHHQAHPYPTDYEKQCLMKETNLSLVQVENWFINARRRVLIDFSRRKRFSTKMKLEEFPSSSLNS